MVLHIISGAISALSLPVHNVWFPYPLAPTIHAARISIAYQANARRSSAPLPWGVYIAGYLIMCWGGTLLTHNLLGVPPPVLYSIHPYINYLTVHVILTGFFYVFPSALNPKIFDTVLFPLDAVVRTGAITGTLSLLAMSSNVPIHPSLIQSPLTHLIIGALASSGGGISASTLSTWTPTWSFSTPPLLRAGLWGSVDFWGGSLVAAIYGVLTHHVAFAGLAKVVTNVLASSGLPLASLGFSEKNGMLGIVRLSPLDAKALSAAALTILFGLRIWKTHWAAAPVTGAKKKGPKGKTQ